MPTTETRAVARPEEMGADTATEATLVREAMTAVHAADHGAGAPLSQVPRYVMAICAPARPPYQHETNR